MDDLIELAFGEPIEVLVRGSTLPLLCRLEEPSGSIGVWVVKLPSLRRPEAAAAEFAASRLLPAFGLSGVEVGVVCLPDRNLVDTFDVTTPEGASLRKAIVQADQRACFACRFINAVEHVEGAFRHRSPEEALRLFFFDAFTWHADRTDATPNILWAAGKMIVIDHARAFHGIEAIDETGLTRFDYSDCRTEVWARHVALGYLRHQWQKGHLGPENCSAIANGLQNLGLPALQKLVTDWPDALDSATFKSDLHRFIQARFNHLPTLAQEISHALSR